MNIAFFMIPKQSVKFLYSDFTVRQALEKMYHSKYTAVPVIDREGKYIGTISEGDLLWYIVKGEGGEVHSMAIESLENVTLESVVYDRKKNPSVEITSSIEDLIIRALETNFVPIVDDRGLFIGIVTRRSIIKHFYDNSMSKSAEINAN